MSKSKQPARLPDLPASLFGRTFHLPVEEQKAHSREPASLAVHRMLGFKDQRPGRTVTFRLDSDREHPVADVKDDGRPISVVTNHVAVAAAASYLEGEEMKRVGKTYPLFKTTMMTEADRLLGTWHGVGVIPMAPDASEFALVRKDHLHPVPGYCQRLAMVGGGMDAHEVLLWQNMEDRATIAITREILEEITDVEIATEMAQQMFFGGSHEACCYLYMKDGTSTKGVVHLFIAPANSPEQWQRWRHLFTPGGDGLGEARPELVSRSALGEALKQEKMAAHRRQALLSDDGNAPTALSSAEVDAPYRRGKDQPPSEWRRLRDEAHAKGVFPLRARGDFSFIAGHGIAINTALEEAGISIV